ncbi:MAG: cysteine peptidase family C39 domain-containing protein [Promethearchaeota archaeon]
MKDYVGNLDSCFHVKVIKQSNPYSCCGAVISMILSIYGIQKTDVEIHKEIGNVLENGVTTNEMVKYLRKKKIKLIKVTPKYLIKKNRQLIYYFKKYKNVIAYLTPSHAELLVGYMRDGEDLIYMTVDPEEGMLYGIVDDKLYEHAEMFIVITGKRKIKRKKSHEKKNQGTILC